MDKSIHIVQDLIVFVVPWIGSVAAEFMDGADGGCHRHRHSSWSIIAEVESAGSFDSSYWLDDGNLVP